MQVSVIGWPRTSPEMDGAVLFDEISWVVTFNSFRFQNPIVQVSVIGWPRTSPEMDGASVLFDEVVTEGSCLMLLLGPGKKPH